MKNLETIEPSLLTQKLVTVARYPFIGLAELAKLHLSENGIWSVLAGQEMLMTDWGLGNALGDVQVNVAESDFIQAREVLSKMRPASTLGDETTPVTDEDQCLACGAEIAPDLSVCSKCGWSFHSSENPEFVPSDVSDSSLESVKSDTPGLLRNMRFFAKWGIRLWVGFIAVWVLLMIGATVARVLDSF